MTKLKHEQVGKEIQFTGYKQKTTKVYKEKGTINIKKKVPRLKTNFFVTNIIYIEMEYYELYANQEDARCYKHLLASVVVFDDDDGQTIVRWSGDVKSTVVHQSLQNFMKISVTGERFLVYYTTHNVLRTQVKLDERGDEIYDNDITEKW